MSKTLRNRVSSSPESSPNKQSRLYPDLSPLQNDSNTSFNARASRSRNGRLFDDGSFSDDPSFYPRPDTSPSSSGSFDDSDEIGDDEVEGLKMDIQLPPITSIHGRYPIHDDQSPAWKPKNEAKTRNRRGYTKNRRVDCMGSCNIDEFIQESYTRIGSVSDTQLSDEDDERQNANKLESNRNGNLLKLFITFVTIFAILYVFFTWKADLRDFTPARPSFEQFRKNFQSVKDGFTSQNSRLWTNFYASSRQQFDESPPKPGVAVIAYSGNDVTARCITSLFADEFSKSFKSKIISIPKQLIKHSKWALDEKLRSAFHSNVKVAIFPNLENFDRDTLLLMHDFCDDQYAPYKNVLFVFLTKIPDHISLDQVDDYLNEQFKKEVGEDESLALVSRIVRNIARVSDERLETLRKFGCG